MKVLYHRAPAPAYLKTKEHAQKDLVDASHCSWTHEVRQQTKEKREKKEGLQEIVELKVCIPTSYVRKIKENGNLNQSVLHICPGPKWPDHNNIFTAQPLGDMGLYGKCHA